MPNFTPLNNGVLVLPMADAFSILEIPEAHTGPKTKGVVVEVGCKVEDVRPGNVVFFKRIEGYPVPPIARIELDGETHYLMPESNILAILTN